ncbi:MAG: PKD domain-containing protein [Solirubrobacteraceae bacterium]
MISTRLLSQLAGLRSAVTRRLTLGLCAATVLSLSLAALSTPAYAHVEEVPTTTKVGAPKIKVGLQPRESEYFWYGPGKYTGLGKGEGVANPESAKFDNTSGNPVVHAANTYAIYWDPQDYYHGDWQSLIDGFLANVGTAGSQLASVFAVDAQYTDKTNKPAASFSTFRGAYTDTHPYPATNGCADPRRLEFGIPFLEGTTTPVCVTAAQVQTELERFIKQREEEHDALPKGMGTIFYLLTPPGVTVCLNEGEVVPNGAHCSDFKGTPIEISRYEEGQKRFPEEEEIYASEMVTYDKAIEKYNEELTKYNEAKTKYREEKETYEAALVNYKEAVVAYEDELAIYKKKRKEAEEKKERDTETEPVRPTEPVKPVEPTAPVKPEHPFKPVYPKTPEGYKTYKQSFCSYHSVIGSGTSAILYAAIPWTAGGDGDYHLTSRDETGGFACQDGGFEPSETELESKEREPTETAKARFEFEEQATGAREAAEEEKEQDLTKPVDQEPNQLGSTRSSDGSYDVGLADLIINQIAVEQQDIVTDPLLNAWQDLTGNEVTDECRNTFVPGSGGAGANEKTLAGTLSDNALGGGSYYLNAGYSLADIAKEHPGVEYPGLPYPAADPCPVGVRLEPKFTAPNTVKGNEVVGFDGMESDISLSSAIAFSAAGKQQPNYATYTWSFGDGSRGDKTPEVSGYAPGAKACEPPWLSEGPPTSFKPAGTWIGCAASVFHQYQYNGTYNVTLTVRDVAGNVATTTGSVTVVEGETWPEEAGGGKGSGEEGKGSPGEKGSPGTSTSGTSSTSGSGTSSTPGASTTKTPGPAPVASAAAVPSSLTKTTKKGLVVSYLVNQQVAGHFEVLLEASIAHRLGLHLPLATGLPAGTPAQVVIGKAILITTKGGRGAVKIQFGKVTGKRLRRLGKVSLMLRLNVRNASGGTVTVLSTFTLH